MQPSDELIRSLREAHDRLNCMVDIGGRSFKSDQQKMQEIDEAMTLCWKAADALTAALSQAPNGAVGVKALGWLDAALMVGDQWLAVAIAYTPFGNYSVEEDDKGAFRVTLTGQVLASIHPENKEAAKAAAQADHGARIRSALTPSPAQAGAEPVGCPTPGACSCPPADRGAGWADLCGEIDKINTDFPNYASWSIELPAGHWRSLRAASSNPERGR